MSAMDGDRRERVGARIRAARRARGLSQSALARMLPGAADGRYVNRWEKGRNMPSWPQLEALADALGVTVAWLVGDDDEDEDEPRPRDRAA